LACIFKTEGKSTLNEAITSFMKAHEQRLLRVCMRDVSFAFNAREIVANTVGRHLLELARAGAFKAQPLIVVLDEAHQFLNKSIGDEFVRLHLDAFDLIAKEGRKYGLTMVMATQRPRDIPDGVLSQMGTLLVHRLINDQDREVVERASGDLDRSAAAFLPTLGPGQAIVVGVDFPVPVVLQIERPTTPPDSKGPNYQQLWGAVSPPT
jgi:DNA helicase HerA-like ATPase